MSYERKIEELLKDNHAKVERSKKHKVYRFPDARIWVVPHSLHSGTAKSMYYDLCKFLNIEAAHKKNPERTRKLGVERKINLTPNRVALRDFRTDLLTLRRYIPPTPCSSAMWLEEVYVSPFVVIIRRLLPARFHLTRL